MISCRGKCICTTRGKFTPEYSLQTRFTSWARCWLCQVSDEIEEQPGEEHLRIQGKKATLANPHPDEKTNFLLVAVDEERQWEGLRLATRKALYYSSGRPTSVFQVRTIQTQRNRMFCSVDWRRIPGGRF